MSDPAPTFEADVLGDEEHERIFLKEIVPEFLDPVEPVSKPKLVLVGGQPGAGKSRVSKQAEEDCGNNVVVTDPDELRRFHPRYAHYTKTRPNEAATLVHPDARKWAWELMQAAMAKGVNVIRDTSMKSPGSALDAAKMAKGELDLDIGGAPTGSYTVEVRVIAVKKELSEQGVRERFEAKAHGRAMWEKTREPQYRKFANALPRDVPQDFQDKTYTGLEESLKALETSPLCDRIVVTDRQSNVQADFKPNDADSDQPLPSAALKARRERPLTLAEFEDYVDSLDKTVDYMREQGKETRATELAELRGQVQERQSLAIEAFKQGFGVDT